MSSNGWKTYKLKDLCTKIGSGATPRGGKEAYLGESPYTLIRSQNVLDFFFSYDGLAYIDEEQASQLNNVELQEKDVLLNITGDSVARVCQVPKELLPARVNQHVSIVRPDSFKLIPEYLKYFLLNPKFKNYMLGLASVGGTRNALTKGMIEDFEIEVPPPLTQRRIADILSALDEKIELNRQTNATLEATAQAIFKEWFVDFNFPGAVGEMVQSELGMIPRGWTVGSIGELFDLVIGGDWGKEEKVEEYSDLCAVIRGTDINDIWFGQSTNVPRRFIKPSSLKKRILKEGDIVFEISGGSKEQATGRNLLITDDVLELFDEKIIPASFCRLIRPNDLSTAVFLGTYLRVLYANGGTWDYQLQSTGISNFQFADFESREKLAIPPSPILSHFKALVLPIYRAIGQLNKQSATLAAIRDALLPKLMGGEIKV